MIKLTIILGMVGGPQVLIILAVAILFFGGKKIPELMKGLGQGIKEFKNTAKDTETHPNKLLK